ncbi:MAG: hypothetical protein PHN45_00390 [Methylococcales bacterium]|nr:hypothetical protein [Methylococcales bacterium]MDD5753198.1 hypothetical protein [Methylococcales bacterium]
MTSFTNKFDERIKSMNGSFSTPHKLVDAAVYVHDTLELASASAQVLFGELVTPEIVLSIFDRISSEHKYLNEYRENDGSSGEVDLSNELGCEIFESLKDKSFFQSFAIEGHTLS